LNVFHTVEETKEGVNPFKKVPPRSDGVVSIYADYKHFNELFHTDSIPEYGSMIDLFGVLPKKSSGIEENSGRRLATVHFLTIHLSYLTRILYYEFYL
jgi:hypothetical protein